MSNSLLFKISLSILTHLIIIALVTDCARTRLRNTLEVKFNFNCSDEKCQHPGPDDPAVNLFQVVASNPESSGKTNFIWSTINGPPMVIAASSHQESELKIDWDVLLNNKQPNNTGDSGFYFNVTQDNTIGLLIEKIIIFDDSDQSGLFTKGKEYFEINWSELVWDLASKAAYHKDDFLKSHLRLRPKHEYHGGNIIIKLAIPRDYKADRQKEVPHLKLNSQSISMAIVIDGVRAKFENARVAMTFVIAIQKSGGPVSFERDSQSLISDEFSPGIFRIKSLQFKTKPGQSQETKSSETIESANPGIYAEIAGSNTQTPAPATPINPREPPSDNLGFLYWKEIAYTDRRKMVSRTVDVFDNAPISLDILPNISQPFYQFYKHKPASGPIPDYELYRFELIFGKNHPSYSNFIDFSFVLGLGTAPREQVFSFFAKCTIFICFCMPFFVMLGGLTYMTLKRIRGDSDTELLLAAES